MYIFYRFDQLLGRFTLKLLLVLLSTSILRRIERLEKLPDKLCFQNSMMNEIVVSGVSCFCLLPSFLTFIS